MHVGATTLAGGDAGMASALIAARLQSAASVEYQRTIDFGTSNGPIDIVATVERFAGAGGASSAYSASVRRLDSVQGAVPASTGPLGDEAHSISVVRTAPDGLQAVEITVVWRVANLVNIIIRAGGTVARGSMMRWSWPVCRPKTKQQPARRSRAEAHQLLRASQRNRNTESTTAPTPQAAMISRSLPLKPFAD